MSAMAMETNGRDDAAAGYLIVRVWQHIKKKVVSVAKNVKKVGEDDPRRILHSFKVGLALTFVSLLYYLRPLYDGFGMAGIWAVLTVVVVFEYSVGATLSKGLNRALATMFSGALAVGVHYMANRSSKAEPVIIGVFVFIIAAAATFTRFFPRVKARYDYGAMIFILTFSLVAVTGYRDDQLFEIAYERLSTVVIGGLVCVFISIFICPVWAGADLHQVAANNLDKLGSFLEGFGSEFFKINEVELEISTANDEKKVEMKAFSQGYKSVLLSKTGEDSLANFARWEPGHGRFRFRHPWRQYLKIGGLARQCAYSIEALNACITSKNKCPVEFQQHIQGPCSRMSLESGKALKELTAAIRGMIKPISAVPHVMSAKAASDELRSILKDGTLPDEFDILEIVPMATVASLLVEIVGHVEEMHGAVDNLAVGAKFKNAAQVERTASQHHRSTVAPLSGEADEQLHVVIDHISESVPSDDTHSNVSVSKSATIEQHVDK